MEDCNDKGAGLPDGQWLGLCASTAGNIGPIPGGGTKIPCLKGKAKVK